MDRVKFKSALARVYCCFRYRRVDEGLFWGKLIKLRIGESLFRILFPRENGEKSVISSGFRATEARRGRWIFWAACSQLGKSGLKIARSVSAPEFLRANRLIVASNIVGRGSWTIPAFSTFPHTIISELFISYNNYLFSNRRKFKRFIYLCRSLHILVKHKKSRRN